MKTQILNSIMTASPAEAWDVILQELWDEFQDPIIPTNAAAITTKKDQNIGALDTLISGSAWELWFHVLDSNRKTSRLLKDFWREKPDGKAVLILDALSMRETNWILTQADSRGYKVLNSKASLAEIPGDTTPFAKALGFNQRSFLTDNGGTSSFFPGAYTECANLPFKDCHSLVKSEPNIIFWNHWPDSAMHQYAADGDGGQKLTRDSAEILTSDDFWKFIERLTTGRELIITGDHGYANSGLFKDIQEKEQIDYMKKLFRSGRSTPATSDNSHKWVPPLTLDLKENTLALGRRKWPSQGGYPTLTHGGLSLLEMAVPFIQIERT